MTPNPLQVASMSQQMGRTAAPGDANAFNKIALACMVTVALGSVIQVVTPLLRELNRRSERNHNERGR